MTKNKENKVEFKTPRLSKKNESALAQKYVQVSVFADELEALGFKGTVYEVQTAIRTVLGVANPLRRKSGSADSVSAIGRMFKNATPEQKAAALQALKSE